MREGGTFTWRVVGADVVATTGEEASARLERDGRRGRSERVASAETDAVASRTEEVVSQTAVVRPGPRESMAAAAVEVAEAVLATGLRETVSATAPSGLSARALATALTTDIPMIALTTDTPTTALLKNPATAIGVAAVAAGPDAVEAVLEATEAATAGGLEGVIGVVSEADIVETDVAAAVVEGVGSAEGDEVGGK